MEKPFTLKAPLAKTLMRSGDDSSFQGLLVDTMSVRIHISDYRSNDILTGVRTVTVPSNAKKAIVYLGSWSIHFGKKELEQHKLSQIIIDFGLLSFEGEKLKVEVKALLRDKLGDQQWEGTFEIILILFK